MICTFNKAIFFLVPLAKTYAGNVDVPSKLMLFFWIPAVIEAKF